MFLKELTIILVLLISVTNAKYYSADIKNYKDVQRDGDNTCWSYVAWSLLEFYDYKTKRNLILDYGSNGINKGIQLDSPLSQLVPYSVEGILNHFSNGTVKSLENGGSFLADRIKRLLRNKIPIPVNWTWRSDNAWVPLN